MNYKRKLKEIPAEEIHANLKFLQLLSKQHGSIESASTEIINLEAILNLPKGTEHFVSDIHAEYDTFKHILSNASGVVRRRIDEIYQEKLTAKEKQGLASLIYYPREKLDLISTREVKIEEWYKVNLKRLIEVSRVVSSKYTRSKVRKSLPKDFQYIIDELLNVNENLPNKEAYFTAIIKTIIDIDRSRDFVIALSQLIQRLAIDRLHIVGDIYDRGPAADKVIDELMMHHSVDIQWGNHDVIWMGAAAGSLAYIAIVLRISARYDNLDTLEDGYGINILPLVTFAMEKYSDDPCEVFTPKAGLESLSEYDLRIIKQVHKAISVIQFKLEGQVIKRNPQFDMDNRLLLDKMDLEKGSVIIDGKKHALSCTNFPTIDPNDPYKLSSDEKELMAKLKRSFLKSEKLQRHINFIYSQGSMYLPYNGLLLFHGAIPMDKQGNFKKVAIGDEQLSGKALLDKFDILARRAYYEKGNPKQKEKDLDQFWYLWCGPESPLFGKKKMTTFERYFVADKNTHKEERNPYYKHRDEQDIIQRILLEFDLNPKRGHVVNGHVPVKVRKGESPVKADGQLIVIDGGMSKAYQNVTGIAGYTLIYNSYGLVLVAHQPFESKRKAVESGQDIVSHVTQLDKVKERKRVADTDIGVQLKQQIFDLKILLAAYRMGIIKEIH
ncbi:MAG: fructose-1,6-bisphosphatase [Bacteroidales bacterium]|nr:fructose-1,6-bisphosphatase [Bacteroidales bacterium]